MAKGAKRWLIVIAVLTAIGSVQWLTGARTGDWVTGTGEITRSEIRSHRGIGGGDRWHLSIRYRFDANGQTWEGSRVVPGGMLGAGVDQATSPDSGAGWLTRLFWRAAPLAGSEHPDALFPWSALYPVGRTVTVFYDPDDPSHAVLTREYANPWFAFAIAIGLLALLWLPIAAVFRWIGRHLGEFRGIRRMTLAFGILGLAVGLLGLWRGEMAARAVPPLLPESGTCPWIDQRPGFVRFDAPQIASPTAPEATGLASPPYARCDGADPAPGCLVDLTLEVVPDGIPLQIPGLTIPTDDVGLQTVLIPPSAALPATAILTQLSTGRDASTPRRFLGRLVRVAALAHVRPEVVRLLGGAMQGATHVLLADRAVRVPPASRLVPLDDCAVLSIPAGADPILYAEIRPNRLELDGPLGPASRALLLEGMDVVTYRKEARTGWDLLAQLGWLMAAGGLLPWLLRATA